MIKTTEILRTELKKYRNPDAKIKRMADAGELIPIVKGLYETDRTVPGHYLAASIYGPSYLSFEFALSYHGLIPEAVYHFTCATFEKKRRKKYDTPFGVFTYRDVPSAAYPAEVSLKLECGYVYQIATAEKAICDMLYIVSPLRNSRGLKEYLFEDLRIEPQDFYRLNLNVMNELCLLYGTQNHGLLTALIKRKMRYGYDTEGNA